ncbi:MAG: FAD-dependent oxidoreductase, partial [Pseudobdellovibrionaceae bacterium]
MSNSLDFDLVIIGAGPGGYVGAIRAAQLGLKTAIVEKEKTYGGTCLNVGCIPSKALLESSEHFAAAKHDLGSHGVKISKVDLDLPTMMARKDKIVKDLTGGLGFLFKKNKIEAFKGLGVIKAPGVVEVQTEDGPKTLNAKNIMIATGS